MTEDFCYRLHATLSIAGWQRRRKAGVIDITLPTIIRPDPSHKKSTPGKGMESVGGKLPLFLTTFF